MSLFQKSIFNVKKVKSRKVAEIYFCKSLIVKKIKLYADVKIIYFFLKESIYIMYI